MRLIFSSLFLLLLLYLGFTNGYNKQQLSENWHVKNHNNSIHIPATVPGGIYSDLTLAKTLKDIYYRFNDIEYRWVANESWTYSTIFKANYKHFHKQMIELVFEGLDTFATIYLNNYLIGNTSNMFTRYEFDVKTYIKKGQNNLTVIFQSPILESQKLYEKQAEQYIVPPKCVPKEYHGECHVNHIRKMQASFSWDWGPAFPSMGIWKPVYLISYDSIIIQDVTVNLTQSDEFWDIGLKVYIKTNLVVTNISGILTTELTTEFNTVQIFTTINTKTDLQQTLLISIPKAHVKLWWPNGYGGQHLYNLKVTFAHMDTEEVAERKIRIGFRKLKLVQNPIENGLTFYFTINDLPIFAKGSNWIPANILPEKGTDMKTIRNLLQSAKDVHMNMLRVWGGGVYESDAFYDIADELGILIWQDFMFACGMYPVNEEFLSSVQTEVEQQVRRLQHHACIAVWAGNNENEAALQGNWYGTKASFEQYKQDYVKLFVDTVRATCLANDATRSFAVSSPSNGLESEKEGYVAKNPYDTHFGDIHYYNYLLDGWNQNIYSKTRFASEYGFQSLPSYATLMHSTSITSDLMMDSDFLNSRQHHLAGYSQMKILINKHLKLPDTSKENYIKTYIYYSQISQAMAIKAQTEFYRQWRSTTDSIGNGLTMGALYWQLNDVWPAPSWSSIDFRQKWKMLHYFAQNFFAPLLVTANISPAQEMTVFTVSDLTTIKRNATLTISVYKWDSFKPMYVENKTLNILPGYSSIVFQVWLNKFLESANCGGITTKKTNCFIYLSLTNSDGDHLGPDNFIFPVPLKSVVGLRTPNLSVKVEKVTSTIFNLTISTDQIAPFVWLETEMADGKFSENGFLQITKYKTIQFYNDKAISAAKLQKSVTITSMLSKEHL